MNTTTLPIAQAPAGNTETYVRDCLIFMDTSAFLHSNYEAFMLRAAPLLKKYNAVINVPLAVLGELKHVLSQHGVKREAAAKAIAHIAKYAREGVLRVQQYPSLACCTAKNAPFVPDFFAELFVELSAKYKLLLITEDVQLAADFSCPEDREFAVHSHPVRVVRIDEQGRLQPVPVEHDSIDKAGNLPNIPESSSS